MIFYTKDGKPFTHAEMVNALFADPNLIKARLSPEALDLWHAATGVCGEAGELLDAVKKHAIYGKEIDRENVIEEMGDLEFYLEAARQNLGITREQVLAHNANKLVAGPNARYGDLKFTNEEAIARADKNGKA